MIHIRLPAWLSAAVPIVAQMQQYRAEWIGRDITAGFSIAAVALPIGVAYPAIAGLPPVVGLYASILPLIAYAIFGSSRQLIVGPDAATLTILAAVLAQILGTQTDQQPADVSAILAVVVGIMCLLSAAARLGFIANFLSRPVLTGYLCGISLALLIGQFDRITTVHLESKGVLRPLFELSGRLEAIHLPTLAIGAGAFILSRLLKRLAPRAPNPLFVLVIATLLAIVFDL